MPKKLKRKPFPTGRVVVDYETDGLQPYDGSRPFIVGMQDEQGNVRKYRTGDPDFRRVFGGIAEDKNVEKIGHGVKFEIKHSRHLGLKPAGKWHDTMAKSVFVDEYQRHSLGELAKKWLNDDSKGVVQDWLAHNGRTIKKESGREPNYTDVPAPLLESYLEGDLDKCLRLDWKFRDVETKFPKLYDLETDLAFDIAEMESNGLYLDMEYIHREIRRLQPEMLEIERRMHHLAGVKFNPAAPAQVGAVMESLGLDTGERTKEGQMKTSYELISALDPDSSPFLLSLIRYRGVQKIVNTYLKPFSQNAVDGVLHGSIWQYGKDKGIVTGRMSSSDPNLHNIPGNRGKHKILADLANMVRRAIVAPPGYSLLFWDFDQVEMRIFTCLAGDAETLDELRRGVDVYVAHGKKMLGEHAFEGLTEKEFKLKRFQAKELNLSMLYGMGLQKFAAKVKLPLDEAKRRRDTYFAASPTTRTFMLHNMRDILMDGYVADTFGRHYHVPRDLSYKGTNAVCQGSSATVLKMAIIRSRQLSTLGVKRLVPIHDEVLAIVPTRNLQEAAWEGTRLLRDTTSFPIPLTVKASYSHTNWAEKKEVIF